MKILLIVALIVISLQLIKMTFGLIGTILNGFIWIYNLKATNKLEYCAVEQNFEW